MEHKITITIESDLSRDECKHLIEKLLAQGSDSATGQEELPFDNSDDKEIDNVVNMIWSFD